MNAGNSRGIAAMVGSMALFVVSDTLIKLASENIGAAQLLFVRGLLLVPVVFVVALRMRALRQLRGALRPRALLRMACEGAGTLVYLLALARIPIATVLAINMVTPLLVLPLATWLLGERIGVSRVTAILAGFAGVLLVLRPSVDGVDFWLLVSLSSAVIFAVRDTVTRTIPSSVPSLLILLGGLVASTVAGGLTVLAEGWRPLDAQAGGYILGSAALVAVAMLLLIQSMRIGEVIVIAPFRYTAILCAVLSGYLVWGDLPDAMTVAGIGLIVLAGLYAILSERFSARGRVPPASD